MDAALLFMAVGENIGIYQKNGLCNVRESFLCKIMTDINTIQRVNIIKKESHGFS